MRPVAALLVLAATAYIGWMGAFTVRACLTNGWGTPGYWASARSLDDDDGLTGCWWKAITKDRVRQQAFADWAQQSEAQARQRDAAGHGW